MPPGRGRAADQLADGGAIAFPALGARVGPSSRPFHSIRPRVHGVACGGCGTRGRCGVLVDAPTPRPQPFEPSAAARPQQRMGRAGEEGVRGLCLRVSEARASLEGALSAVGEVTCCDAQIVQDVRVTLLRCPVCPSQGDSLITRQLVRASGASRSPPPHCWPIEHRGAVERGRRAH